MVLYNSSILLLPAFLITTLGFCVGIMKVDVQVASESWS